MQDLPGFQDPNLLVGPEHFSDAGVYKLDADTAIVQTVDFFPPLVDDPFVFGQIAAANAMSDVYAMGGRPKTALNIVGFPDEVLDLGVLSEILKGGAERVKAAGAVILGGHSVRDEEIKYGLAVTGIVHPDRMLTNDAARPGDVVVLTKALGTGFITTALRRGKCADTTLATAIASMTRLNDDAMTAALAGGAHAATDVTGFALAGHALEMARASGVTIAIDLPALPVLPDALKLAEAGHHTRANATNRKHVDPHARYKGASGDAQRLELIFDPQTSGGLLVAMPADAADAMVGRCRDAGLDAAIIGAVRELDDVSLVVRA